MVAYLVPSLKTRSMLLEFRKARAPDIEVPSVAAAPAEEIDPPQCKARECDEGQYEELNKALVGRTRRRSKSTECSEVEPPKWFKYIHGQTAESRVVGNLIPYGRRGISCYSFTGQVDAA
jgi:hypothetical protein